MSQLNRSLFLLILVLSVCNDYCMANLKETDPEGDPSRHISINNFSFGINITLGGNQENGIKIYTTYTGVHANNWIGLETGARLGINLYSIFKADANIISEASAAWYLGGVLGTVSKTNNLVLTNDEFKFAGSGIHAIMRTVTWGIGGIGILTDPYKAKEISNYLGTQYLKLSFGNVNVTLNHTNDAMMTGFWLRKGLPPILGFFDTDWHRTTELSASVNISMPSYALCMYGKASLFTPKVLIDSEGERVSYETGNMRNGKPQSAYILDPGSHGTFFSYYQVGITGTSEKFTGALNYSFNNPQPQVQNHFAHDDGYRFPIFLPQYGMPANQSNNMVGLSAAYTPQIK